MSRRRRTHRRWARLNPVHAAKWPDAHGLGTRHSFTKHNTESGCQANRLFPPRERPAPGCSRQLCSGRATWALRAGHGGPTAGRQPTLDSLPTGTYFRSQSERASAESDLHAAASPRGTDPISPQPSALTVPGRLPSPLHFRLLLEALSSSRSPPGGARGRLRRSALRFGFGGCRKSAGCRRSAERSNPSRRTGERDASVRGEHAGATSLRISGGWWAAAAQRRWQDERLQL